ncbi:OLC1v1006957C1 [Oldenlandia corymbosa var. corymbosa]|nr:OLC1v1006957C1 [Oldenlandia corymbosa var. corymbosa]
MKITLARRRAPSRKQSQSYGSLPMSVPAASLLLEAIFLKSKSLEALGRYKEAAQTCSVILDVVESSSPGGLPETFAGDCKLQETLSKAVEFLPELWKLTDSPSETILSYQRSLLHPWTLDAQTLAGIQKEFAIYLLYGGAEADPPNLQIQMDRGFLSFANQMEELLPGAIERKDQFENLALCYYGEGDELIALNLLRKLLSRAVDPAYVPALLLASKICGENSSYAVDGIKFARRAIENLQGKCDQLTGIAKFLLGISLSTCSRSATTDSERVQRQTEALQSLEAASKITKMNDPKIVYHLCLEHAEQRELDASLYYAKCLLKLDSGSNIRGWLSLARILSAQKRFEDAETVINAALNQTGKWDQGELLRTKAKLQIAQGHLKDAIETYTRLLAVLQVQLKSFGSGEKLKDGRKPNRSLELETWNDLAVIYIKLNKWRDAEICLSKSEAISCHSARRLHTAGLLHEAKGLHKESRREFDRALSVDPTHIPSLVSVAVVHRKIGTRSATFRRFLTEAIQLDRMNVSAWYNLGLVCKDEGPGSAMEAGVCFQAAASLEETEPVEPFR